MRMTTFLRGLDDWLTREDPDVSVTAEQDVLDAAYGAAMEAIGVTDGDAADEAYHRLQRIEERNERAADFQAARSLIYRPTL